MTASFSVVVPAHDEEAVIGRCLDVLLADAEPGEIEVVVVANGCRDATAEAARRAAPSATVVELAAAGKVGALNAGDDVAVAFPRLYVDADVELPTEAARAVADALRDPAVATAAPRPAFELAGRPWAVRAFYRTWAELPYLQGAVVGSGVYGLSEAAHRRLGRFPDVVADDQYVMDLFDPAERRALDTHRFTVHPPTTVAGVLAVRRRVHRGNRQLDAVDAPPADATRQSLATRLAPLAALAGRRPWRLPEIAVYFALNAWADLAGRRGGTTWERDHSARTARATSPASVARVGYLVSRYPSLSHSFVAQEVAAVRAAGLAVDTFSIRAAEPAELLSARDRAEAASTWSVRPVAPAAVVATHARLALAHPRAWASTLAEAVRAAPPGLRAAVWQALYFAEAGLLLAECRRRGVRHLHAHLANVAADVAALTVRLGRRVEPGRRWSWSFTMHGPTEFFDVGHYRLRAKVADADLVIAISEFARSQLMATTDPSDWPKLRVVHMGADLARWSPPAATGTPGQPAGDGTAARPLRVLSVGRLDPVKGQLVLVDAVALLRDRGVAVRLVLVGEGPARPALEERIAAAGLAGTVTLAGAVGHDDLAGRYHDADVFGMASFAEGIPVVLMEAMASGLAVVATQVNGIPELIQPGVTGLLVPPGRPDLLADALAGLAEPSARAALAAAGTAKVRAEFDAAACGAQVAALLRAVAAGG